MKFKRHTKMESGLKQIDLAPLVDVIFQLLIFFMLSSSFTFQTGIKVKLPKAVTSDVIQDENYLINLSGEDVTYLNGKVTTLKEIEEVLRRSANQDKTVLIKADKRSSMGRVVEIWDLCRQLNIQKVNIATVEGQGLTKY